MKIKAWLEDGVETYSSPGMMTGYLNRVSRVHSPVPSRHRKVRS
jgi:hypothetical protein